MSRDITIRDEYLVDDSNDMRVLCPFGHATIEADIECTTRCAWLKTDMPMRLAIKEDGKTTMCGVFCGNKYIGTITE